MFLGTGARVVATCAISSGDDLHITVAARDVELVVALAGKLGLEPDEDERTWDHMDALLGDAALQPRARYRTTVWLRARKVYDKWGGTDQVALGSAGESEYDGDAEVAGAREVTLRGFVRLIRPVGLLH
ncbi:hypothetical protein [Rhodococcus rhodochrous]|uniref:hypothetical protein n=1 Tax=Rhodococcus rhodochrous TaxID=1829 RepID=UPI00128EAD58|nr:hypothetical protein [Rhodococcus rhodochrous]